MPKSMMGIFLRGLCMGAADLVPGVSGGTVALITGIYDRLLAALAVFASRSWWGNVARLDFAAAWRHADGGFLLMLAAGIGGAVLMFSRALKFLLEAHAHLLLAFFAGLVLASAVAIAGRLRTPSRKHGWLAGAGFVAALVAVNAPLAPLAPSLFNFFVAGAVAICAMLLPGISGSYVLLILGLYGHLIESLHDREWTVLLVFVGGCAGGVLCFARLMAFVLRRAPDATVSVLVGVMLGALPKLWPWKESAPGAQFILQKNVSPAQFAADPQLFAVGALFLAGALCIWAAHAVKPPGAGR